MSEIIHRTKNFGGQIAQQVHADMAWYGQRCDACKGPPSLKVFVYLVLADMTVQTREAVEFEIAMGRIQPIRGPRGMAVLYASKVACSSCAPALERAVARRVPSWAHVVFDRGPGADSPIVAVAANI